MSLLSWQSPVKKHSILDISISSSLNTQSVHMINRYLLSCKRYVGKICHYTSLMQFFCNFTTKWDNVIHSRVNYLTHA